MAPRISVRPEGLSALADELAALATALAADGDRCLSAAGTLDAALGGRAGATAGAVALAWGRSAGTLVEGTRAVAGTLRAAVDSYRAGDQGLAGSMGAP